jgi:hypothetical protein
MIVRRTALALVSFLLSTQFAGCSWEIIGRRVEPGEVRGFVGERIEPGTLPATFSERFVDARQAHFTLHQIHQTGEVFVTLTFPHGLDVIAEGDSREVQLEVLSRIGDGEWVAQPAPETILFTVEPLEETWESDVVTERYSIAVKSGWPSRQEELTTTFVYERVLERPSSDDDEDASWDETASWWEDDDC